MAGLRKRDLLSNESSLKYFLMGTFSTGFLLFGIAMLYGATGSYSINEIAYYLGVHRGTAEPFVIAGIILLMIGLLFKAGAAPFQFWTPDVYQGAPTVVTGYMATIGKVAAFAAFLRLFQLGFDASKESYQLLLGIIAVVTMFVGNITAIYQHSVKRMLAYSSIAHAGYMLIALTTMNDVTNGSVLFYSVAYTAASMAAFVIVMVVQQKRGGDDITMFNGLAKSNPVIALVFAVAMFSLAGIPPTAGFFAKFYIFSSAIKDGWIWLIALAVVNSFISVYYYFRPVIASYMRKGNEEKVNTTQGTLILLIALALLTILLGIFPGFITGII
jgi:NADH-quinone oxidoreductase subunit N